MLFKIAAFVFAGFAGTATLFLTKIPFFSKRALTAKMLCSLCFVLAGVCSVAASGFTSYAAFMLGGLLLGAFFMATDYSTSPIKSNAKIVFGIGCGLITFLIRQYGGYPEGVSFSIILMNLLVPHIEKLTTAKPFGTPKKDRKAEKKAKKAEKEAAKA